MSDIGKYFTRILFGVTTLVSVFILPWWGAASIVIVLLFRFIPYYEVFLFGIVFDALYSIILGDAGFGFIFTFLFSVLFYISLFLKERIRIAE